MFQNVIVRKPARSLVEGITSAPELGRPDYDLASLGPGVRGKSAGRLKRTTLVALWPEVAAAFPSADAVNEGLKAVMKVGAVMRRSPRAPRRHAGSKG